MFPERVTVSLPSGTMRRITKKQPEKWVTASQWIRALVLSELDK